MLNSVFPVADHFVNSLLEKRLGRSKSAVCTAHPTGRSRRTGLAYPNGAGIAYSYDAASRLLYIDNQTNSGQHKYAYTYDKVGNRKDMTVTSPSGVGVHLYDYDKIYQVTEVDYPDELDYLATDTTFNYDDAGNRLSVIDANGTTPYVANALNQYTSANGTYYQYDTSGNMIYDGHYVFDYDPENRLNKVKRFEQGPTAMALACDTTLTFTMGGDADWFTQTQEHYFEGDAAQSGDIGDSQYSSMEATVSGTGYISFYWKVSTDGSGDYLRFYIDDQLKEEHGGVAGWNQSTKYYISTGGSHTLKWVYAKNSTGSGGSDCAWVDKILWEVPTPIGVDKGVDSLLTYTSGGNSTWSYVAGGYYGGDSAQSGSIPDSNETWMQTTVEGAGTFKFWWKVSSESGADYLEFYIDNQLQTGSISGTTSWAEKTYTLTGAGTHTLKWRYVKDSSGESGEDCGWVDHVQWSAPIAEPATDAWTTLTYTYDAAGRRIEKRYDDTLVLKYIYDSDHCIAEYDAGNNLRRKYIFGPGVDEPICMIDASQENAVDYYHFDGLNSVVALTDETGDVTQVYEYSIYGQVGATNPNHPNRFTFTGREFDKETGLYYYRARYYNAEIGRFLQTDPIGYGDGMNLYRYCRNNPLNRIDPFGLEYIFKNDPNFRKIYEELKKEKKELQDQIERLEKEVGDLKGQLDTTEQSLWAWSIELQDSINGYYMWWCAREFWAQIAVAGTGTPPGPSGNPWVDTFNTAALFAQYMMEQAEDHMAEQEAAIEEAWGQVVALSDQRNALSRQYGEKWGELSEKKKRLEEVKEQLALMWYEDTFNRTEE